MAIHQLLVEGNALWGYIFFALASVWAYLDFGLRPDHVLANQRMSSLIGLGNPSCLSITIAYTALSSKWGEMYRVCFVGFLFRIVPLILFSLSLLYNSQILPTATFNLLMELLDFRDFFGIYLNSLNLLQPALWFCCCFLSSQILEAELWSRVKAEPLPSSQHSYTKIAIINMTRN